MGSICPLCGFRDASNTTSGLEQIIECIYCGQYIIDRESLRRIDFFVQNDVYTKLKIAAIAYEFNLQCIPIAICANGESSWRDYVTITPEELVASFPLTINRIIDRSLMNLDNNSKSMGHPLFPKELRTSLDFSCFFSLDYSQFSSMLKIMREMKYIDVSGNTGTMVSEGGREPQFSQPIKIALLPAGYARIQQLENEPPGGSPQAFVAMWFDDSRLVYYTDAIAPAIQDAHKGYIEVESVRIDYVPHNDKICDKIISEIRKSHYVVADVTGNNAGAYYEAGFAQGLGIPVIWAVDENVAKEKPMHFDVRQYNTVFYSSVEDLKEKLTARIARTIPIQYLSYRKEGPLRFE